MAKRGGGLGKGIIIIVFLLFIGLGIFALANKGVLKSLKGNFKLWGAAASTEIEFWQARTKNGDEYNYTVKFKTPHNANVELKTASSDVVAVTSVRQEGSKTIVELEPVKTFIPKLNER